MTPTLSRKALLTTYTATIHFRFTPKLGELLGSNNPMRIIRLECYSKAWFLSEVMRQLTADGVSEYITSIEVK